MTVKTLHITIDKPERELYVTNITPIINKEIEKSGVKEGAVIVFAPGSTAGVITIEYEPYLMRDLEKMFERLVPSDLAYEHSKAWGEANGKSHLRASLIGASETIPFVDGKMMLGQWQHLVVMDFDVRSRKRDLVVQIIS